ncbi:MAG TPA: dihydroorotate dehydrogenase [Candidatus Acidoferrales bacterium]|nr:dihydroorotate dehydrogenase [Candidatus Acidoferrales bacterium]
MSARQADRATRSLGVNLRVEVGSLSLQNPIIAASGTFGYGIEFAHLVDLNKLGGGVVKGLSIRPKTGNLAPRMCETTSGMLNSIGLQNIGVKGFIAEKLPKLRPYRVPIIANVFGETTAEYVEVIRILEDAEGIAAYELNISCPNVEHGGAEYSTDPSLTAEVVKAARKAASRPLWVKLSPAIGIIGLIAKEAENSGADALVVANTYPALCIDAHNRRSRIGSTTGGLSGAAVKPITMRLVNELSRVIRIPIIGLGGIESPTDVAEYMLAGASAVEVGTAHFADPRASEKLVEGLEKWCRDENLSEIGSLRGALQTDQPRQGTRC